VRTIRVVIGEIVFCESKQVSKPMKNGIMSPD